jgi:hypothetical protein
MTYEYTIEFFSLERTSPEGAGPEETRNMVYACGEEGECAIKDLREEQTDLLVGFMNEMGSKGWELVQVLFNRNGAVSFWKRAIVDLGNQNR